MLLVEPDGEEQVLDVNSNSVDRGRMPSLKPKSTLRPVSQYQVSNPAWGFWLNSYKVASLQDNFAVVRERKLLLQNVSPRCYQPIKLCLLVKSLLDGSPWQDDKDNEELLLEEGPPYGLFLDCKPFVVFTNVQ